MQIWRTEQEKGCKNAGFCRALTAGGALGRPLGGCALLGIRGALRGPLTIGGPLSGSGGLLWSGLQRLHGLFCGSGRGGTLRGRGLDRLLFRFLGDRIFVDIIQPA